MEPATSRRSLCFPIRPRSSNTRRSWPARFRVVFVTRSSWAAIGKELPAQAQQFALANDFTAKPGKCLALPSLDGKIAQVLFGLEEGTSKSIDLFRPGASWRDDLLKRARAGLAGSDGIQLEDADVLDGFFVTPGQLHLLVEVAHVDGDYVEVSVPLADLSAILDPALAATLR